MRLQRRRFTEPSDTRTFPHGRVDVVELDDYVIGQMTYQPGWRWSVDVKPIAGTDTCQYHHIGYTVSGRLRIQMPDGTELETGPGEVFESPPGHDAWVVGDEPWVCVDFEAMRTYGKKHDAESERTLASIVITDILESTQRAIGMGAAAWRDVMMRGTDLPQNGRNIISHRITRNPPPPMARRSSGRRVATAAASASSEAGMGSG